MLVLKYGGSTLSTPQKIKQVAAQIADLSLSGEEVVVAVSAMGQTTNDLIQLARAVAQTPARRELDMLLTTGERVTASLLAIALNDLKVPSVSLTGSQAGVLTDDSHSAARILNITGVRVREELAKKKVVILAGFQGVSPRTKEITTLGRGGTDLTAVAMAIFLKADRCEILKDVDGVFNADPKVFPEAKMITELSHAELSELSFLGAKMIHSRAAQLAEANNVPLWIGSTNRLTGTSVNMNDTTKGEVSMKSDSSEKQRLGPQSPQPQPLPKFEAAIALAITGHKWVLEVSSALPFSEIRSLFDGLELPEADLLWSSLNESALSKSFWSFPQDISPEVFRLLGEQVQLRKLSSVSLFGSLLNQRKTINTIEDLCAQRKIKPVGWNLQPRSLTILVKPDDAQDLQALFFQTFFQE